MNELHHRKFISCDVINVFQIEQFESGRVNNVDTSTTHEIQGVPMYGKINSSLCCFVKKI
jgi:hypothetical protein